MRKSVLGVVAIALAACGDVPFQYKDAAVDMQGGTDAAIEQDAMPDAPPVTVAQVAAGHGTACAVTSSGTVKCWGANEFGQLGVAPSTTTTICSAFGRGAPCRATPEIVAGLSNVASVAVGFYHACAVKTDGTVWCWGINANGELGHDPATDEMCGSQRCHATPTAVAGLTDVAEVAVGGNHTCARTNGGAVRCWGTNGGGNLGNGAAGGSSHTPTNAGGLTTGVTRIAAAGFGHTTCAIKSGEVYCWGIAYPEGNLGHDPANDPVCGAASCAATPVKVPSLSGAFDLAVGERTVCVAIAGGSVRCWGSNLVGQLGISTSEPSGYAHRAVPGVTQVVSLSGSMAVTCARTQAGALYCWGLADTGGIGDGSTAGASCSLAPCRPTPTLVSLPDGVAKHSSGSSSLVLLESGAVSTWGTNGFGELGHAPSTNGDVTCGSGTCNAAPSSITIL